MLEMVAKGDSLPEILDSVCQLVEEQASGVLASTLLPDGNRLRSKLITRLPGSCPQKPHSQTHKREQNRLNRREETCSAGMPV